jgi:hypothetical protein
VEGLVIQTGHVVANSRDDNILCEVNEPHRTVLAECGPQRTVSAEYGAESTAAECVSVLCTPVRQLEDLPSHWGAVVILTFGDTVESLSPHR